jgi:hypothetical protein
MPHLMLPKQFLDPIATPVRLLIPKPWFPHANNAMNWIFSSPVNDDLRLDLSVERGSQRIEVFFQERSCGFLTPVIFYGNTPSRRTSYGQATFIIPL